MLLITSLKENYVIQSSRLFLFRKHIYLQELAVQCAVFHYFFPEIAVQCLVQWNAHTRTIFYDFAGRPELQQSKQKKKRLKKGFVLAEIN